LHIHTYSFLLFPIPQAGHDKAWLNHYVTDFKKLADAGDTDFANVIQELEARKDLKDLFSTLRRLWDREISKEIGCVGALGATSVLNY
jgi:hypothetical protein